MTGGIPSAGHRYWESSRAPRYSLLFVLPLVLAYEALAIVFAGDSGIRNGADVVLRTAAAAVLGPRGPLVAGLILTAVCAVLLVRDLRASGRIRPGVVLLMAAESATLALIFGVVVGTLTTYLIGAVVPFTLPPQGALSFQERLMVSLGAGVYEELLFRVILVSGLGYCFGRVFGWEKRRSAITAVLIAAGIFSTFHYVGPLGDPFDARSFMFRYIAGVLLSGLYVLRGFGITAWTHALYDVYLL